MLFNDPNAMVSEQSSAVDEGLPSLVGKRLVIIEDDGLTQALLRRACAESRIIVVGTANTGQGGVDLALEQKPDIVLTDINMPVMDGLEAARQVLAQMRVCVILMTGNAMPEDPQEITRLGVHGYLTKPVTKDILIPAIQDAYARFREGRSFAFSRQTVGLREESVRESD